MLLFFPVAHAAPPGPIEPSALPAIPEVFVGKVSEECRVEMVSDASGRLHVIAVSDCIETFEKAVRDRLSWLTWKTPPPLGEGPLDPTHAILTGYAGVPGGLYVRMGIRFERDRDGGNANVTVVPQEVVHPKKAEKVPVPDGVRAELAQGCLLLVHVDEEGRTERVQAQTCSEAVRKAVELPLMAWTWEPLVVEGERKAFAATFRMGP